MGPMIEVEAGSIPEGVTLFREDQVTGLLYHICHVDEGDKGDPVDIIYLGLIRFHFVGGFYFCEQCKRRYKTEEELEMIYEDGQGTGEEGHA